MAAGQLVPHVLPNGQTIMVPGYLAPQPALAMPNVQPPSAGPDRRVAGGVMQGWGDEIPTLPEPTEQEKAASLRAKLMPQQPAAPSSNEHTTTAPKNREEELARIGSGKRSQPAGVDPSSVVIGQPKSQQAEQSEGGGLNPLVQAAMIYSPGGGGPRRSGGLEVGSVKEERQPGVDLLPEQKWRMGLEARPQELYEVDPTVPQSTIGTADPVMREKQTGIEKGAAAAAETERKAYELQVDQAHKQSVAEREQLAAQSNLVDEQLGIIAERRTKIAKLQEMAEQRAQEAQSMQPRTREQVWGSKGNVARGLAILSAVLGGLVGNNNGWNMIDKSINEAVDDDRYEAERRAKLGLAAKNDYEHALTLYGDPQMAALDAKNRKLANMAAMAKSQAADPGLDPMAKERAVSVYNTAYNNYLEGVRKLAEGIEGKVLTQEVNYKQAPATGGGGGSNDPLARLKRGADATKYLQTITGEENKPKPNPTEQAELNKQEAGLAPLKSLLDRYKGSDEIPGIQAKGAPKRALRGAIDWVAGEGAASASLDTDEERANRMIVARAALQYRNDVTGAGGSARELADIDQAFAGARTRADLANAVRTAEQIIARRRELSSGAPSTAKAPAPTPSTFRPE